MVCVSGSPLYQWDKNRQVKIESVDPATNLTIHCCLEGDSNTLVVEPIVKEDGIFANIPNILLQRCGRLRVYVVIEGYTVYDTTFYILARPKPDDYIYEETEILSIERAVNEALQRAKDSGDFKGDPGEKGEPGDDYVFTDADKQDVVNAVLKALPTWTGGLY